MFDLLWVRGNPSLDGLPWQGPGNPDADTTRVGVVSTQVPGICRAVLSTEEAGETDKTGTDSAVGTRITWSFQLPETFACAQLPTAVFPKCPGRSEGLGASPIEERRDGAWTWASGTSATGNSSDQVSLQKHCTISFGQVSRVPTM